MVQTHRGGIVVNLFIDRMDVTKGTGVHYRQGEWKVDCVNDIIQLRRGGILYG